ncbi:TonB-dependent receptor [Parasphingorhabdus sp.]|uniref:TonB-dependent receptor n=1 Tax=Parasphingorhabdus sp. TaxID=2709688 RepID=UPI003264D7A9
MRITKFLAATALGSVISVAPAIAQGVQDDEVVNDNIIIVTASKRESTLQETPIAVSVTSAAQIEEAQVRDLLDLQTLVPSLRVNQLQTSANTNFSIRGFGNGANNPGIEPSVGVFIDGVYRSRSAAQIGDLPNLQRVEVLRGPQSTLFGKNASAGIISIVTRKPQFEFGGSAELSYGNFNAIVAKADITGPINDSLAFSLSGNFNKRDGYVRDLALNEDANERNRWGVRGQLLFEPDDDLSFRFIGDYDKIDEDCCSVVNIVDGPTGGAVRFLGGQIDSNNPFSRISFLNFNSTNEIENYGVSLQTDYSTGPFDITAITAYRAVRSSGNQDSDFTSADLIGVNRGEQAIDTYTAELRLTSDFDGPLNFLLGGLYFKEDIQTNGSLLFGADFQGYADLLSGGNYTGLEPTLRALIPTIPAGAFGAEGQGRFTSYDYGNTAFSIFGQLDFEITEDLIFTAGGNYTQDRKNVAQNNVSTDVFSGIDLVQAGVLAGVPAVVAADPNFNPFLGLQALQFIPPYLNFPNAVEDGRTRDKDFSYTLRLAYNFSENISAYASYSTGFKASSFNLGTDSRPFPADFIPGSPFQSPPPAASPIRDAGLAVNNLSIGTRFADPENAEVYEVGIKGQFEGLAFNIAVFDQILTDFQGNIFTGTGFVLGNADERSTFGIEIDSTITPVPNLVFTAALTYLDSKYDSFPGGSAINAGFGVTPTDLSGGQVAGVPEYAVTVGGTYTHEFGNDNELIFHADYLMESNTQVAEGLPTIRRAVEALNASLTFAMGNGVSVTAWGRNLTNDVYTTTVFPSVAQGGSLSGYRNQPRTYGGAVKFKF